VRDIRRALRRVPVIKTRRLVCERRPENGEVGDEAEGVEEKELDDETLARALHREMNCTPARSSRRQPGPVRKGPDDHPVSVLSMCFSTQ
jgi:hypothetical protein